MHKLSIKSKYKDVKYFAFNGNKNELKNFYHT